LSPIEVIPKSSGITTSASVPLYDVKTPSLKMKSPASEADATLNVDNRITAAIITPNASLTLFITITPL
jgi:hypothetical protein